MGFKDKVVAKVPQLTSWSYSRYSDWANCPLKAKLKHVDRIKEPGNAAMQRGSDIHTQAEEYVKGTLAKLPPTLALFKEEFTALRKLYKKKAAHPMIVEDNWAFTKDWAATQWDDWVGCYLRIKLDCAHYVADGVMVVTDWKTGKPSSYKAVEYMEQLELYALAALLLHDHLTEVQVRIGWIDVGEMYPAEPARYYPADTARLRKEWGMRVKPMMADTKFVPKPNRLCAWCYYGQAGKAKGGPGLCKY